jgi:hypothetical protein
MFRNRAETDVCSYFEGLPGIAIKSRPLGRVVKVGVASFGEFGPIALQQLSPVATSTFVRSKAGSNRKNINERSSRFSNSRSALQGDWGRKAICRKAVPTGDRNDVWEMAAATSAHAGDAAFGRGCKGDACGSRIWLWYAQRFHVHVQESLRNHAKFVF